MAKTKKQKANSKVRIQSILADQRRNFGLGTTQPYDFRILQLKTLRRLISENERRLLTALKQDLGKPEFEAYASEIGFLYAEIDHTIKHLKAWMTPETASTPLILLPSRSKIYSEPRGVTLIIGAWNYPLQLVLAPLVGSLAAGNCAILKPSELAPACEEVVSELIARYFAADYVACVPGGVTETQLLLKEKFDYIFFTGSTQVGRLIGIAAAETLTPCTLELGGKSPCIVDREVDMNVAVRRIVWGKFFNAGQTCVAPDYLLVPHEKRDEFVNLLGRQIRAFFSGNPAQSPDLGRIVNRRHFDRLLKLLKHGRIAVGGDHNHKQLYISPTVITDVELKHPIMREEIFGPLLPVLTYRTLDEAFDVVRSLPEPLSLYFFSGNRKNQKRLIRELSFGGGCINNVLEHLGNPNLPFGGRGDSGYGSYHGKHSFDLFSHKKSVMKSGFFPDIRMRYQPYGRKIGILRRLMG